MAKKALACALCLALQLPGPAAALGSVDVREAAAFFERAGLFRDETGAPDPLRSFVYADGGASLTPLGELFYRRLSARSSGAHRPAEEFQGELDSLRRLGAMTPEAARGIDDAVRRALREYGGGSLAGLGRKVSRDGSDPFLDDLLLRAAFDGAGSPQAHPGQYARISTPDQQVLADKEGVAARISGSGVVVFDRELQRRQKRMNEAPDRPPAAPAVPETGRYNQETLLYGVRRLEAQIGALERGLELDRLGRIAELLGEGYHEDQYLKDGEHGHTLREALLRRGERSLDDIPFRRRPVYDAACGGYLTTVLEFVDCRQARMRREVSAARRSVDAYARRVQGLRSSRVLPEAELEGLDADERLATKRLTLAYIEGQRLRSLGRLERLDYELSGGELRRIPGGSPDAASFAESLRESPFPCGIRSRYADRSRDLAARLHRLLAVFGKLETDLRDSDHVTGLGRLQAALGAAQTELGETELDLAVFVSLPALAFAGRAQDDGLVPAATRWGARLAGLASGGRLARGYLSDRRDLSAYREGLDAAARRLAGGDFRGARARLIATAPEAVRTCHRTEVDRGGGDGSEAQRAHSVLRRIGVSLERLEGTHRYSGVAVHLGAWSLGLAAAAPAAGFLLSGAAHGSLTMARALAAMGRAAQGAGRARTAMALKAASFLPRAAGAVGEHAAIRLASLGPSPGGLASSTVLGRALEAGMVRTLNSSARLGSFSLLLSGGLSGTLNAGVYGLDRLAGDGNSPMSSAGEAFLTGYAEGARWAAGAGRQSWAPLLLFAGLPADVFEGTPAAAAAGNLAAKGLAGNLASAARLAPGLERLGVPALEVWARHGGWRAGLSTALAVGDQAAKYFVLSQGAGAAARFVSRRVSSPEEGDAERELKRAHASGQRHEELPYWLLLPVHPARYEAGAGEARLGVEGYRQYEAAGILDRIANSAADVGRLPLLRAPRPPLWQRFFDFRWRGEAPGGRQFTVSREMKREAIRAELAMAVPDRRPLEFHGISRQNGGVTGRLYVTEEVRDAAQRLFEEAVLGTPGLARRLLAAQPGRELPGFGPVRSDVRQEAARIVVQNRGRMSPAEVAAAERLLEPYMRTERAVSLRAKDLLDALGGMPRSSPGLRVFLDEMLAGTRSWRAEPRGGYMELVRRFRQRAREAGLPAGESLAVEAALDYVEAVQSRFRRFDRVDAASARAEAALDALRVESLRLRSRRVAREIEAMADRVERWKESCAAPDAAVGESYKKMVESSAGRVRALRGLDGEERALLARAVEELQAAPWLLKDSRGNGLPGWLPEQFEGLMFFLDSLLSGGSGPNGSIRTFLLMRTGGGKTLLAFEGILPIAQADAAARGKKVVFLTVQSNLEAQARLEYRALRRLEPLSIDTWESFKGRVAQGKLGRGERPEDYWVLGDELDGAALQPALSIGEAVARIPRFSAGREDPVYAVFRRMRDAVHPLAGAMSGRRLARLARGCAGELLRAVSRDPALPAQVRWKLFWTLLPSMLRARGGWVEAELLNLARGWLEPGGSVRMDNLTGRVNPIHNGQWFESMDTPTRRFWELGYGADLTLPYEHKAAVTMDDFLRDGRRMRFVGFSGTGGSEFRRYLRGHGVLLTGVGTPAVEAGLLICSSPARKYAELGRLLRTLRAQDAVRSAEGGSADGILVAALPDTRSLRTARSYLLRSGLAEPEEIAMVFSDAELLRLERPRAMVERQMNLEGLTTGRVKVLLLDARVGGRGLDLSFKGARDPGPAGFRGYRRFEMLVLDPQSMSGSQLVQAQGRIDLGRVPAGSARRFTLVLDAPGAQREPLFARMLEQDPVFRRMKGLPAARRLARQAGLDAPDWAVLHRCVEEAEARGQGGKLAAEYRRAVRAWLDLQQRQVEREQMRSAGI